MMEAKKKRSRRRKFSGTCQDTTYGIMGGSRGCGRAPDVVLELFRRNAPDGLDAADWRFLFDCLRFAQPGADWDEKRLLSALRDGHELEGLSAETYGPAADARYRELCRRVSAWSWAETQYAIHATWWAGQHFEVLDSPDWWTLGYRAQWVKGGSDGTDD